MPARASRPGARRWSIQPEDSVPIRGAALRRLAALGPVDVLPPIVMAGGDRHALEVDALQSQQPRQFGALDVTTWPVALRRRRVDREPAPSGAASTGDAPQLARPSPQCGPDGLDRFVSVHGLCAGTVGLGWGHWDGSEVGYLVALHGEVAGVAVAEVQARSA